MDEEVYFVRRFEPEKGEQGNILMGSCAVIWTNDLDYGIKTSSPYWFMGTLKGHLYYFGSEPYICEVKVYHECGSPLKALTIENLTLAATPKAAQAIAETPGLADELITVVGLPETQNLTAAYLGQTLLYCPEHKLGYVLPRHSEDHKVYGGASSFLHPLERQMRFFEVTDPLPSIVQDFITRNGFDF